MPGMELEVHTTPWKLALAQGLQSVSSQPTCSSCCGRKVCQGILRSDAGEAFHICADERSLQDGGVMHDPYSLVCVCTFDGSIENVSDFQLSIFTALDQPQVNVLPLQLWRAG